MFSYKMGIEIILIRLIIFWLMELTGIILAGGKSSRMGEDKGLMLFEGKPMIQYIIIAFMFIDRLVPI